MCGIGGYAAIGKEYRRAVTALLTTGIDRRGGHASGYVSLCDNKSIVHGRTDGPWSGASLTFKERASEGLANILHARFATCGKRALGEAHPFQIDRNGKTVLWGVHNGVIRDADDSAKVNGREYSVDSLELFELLADGKIAEIGKLHGYGTIVWVETAEPNNIHMVRLTNTAELYIARVKGGGSLYGSTRSIVETAAKDAKLELDGAPWEPGTGVPHYITIHDGEIYYKEKTKIELASQYDSKYYNNIQRSGGAGYYNGWYGASDFAYSKDYSHPVTRILSWCKDCSHLHNNQDGDCERGNCKCDSQHKAMAIEAAKKLEANKDIDKRLDERKKRIASTKLTCSYCHENTVLCTDHDNWLCKMCCWECEEATMEEKHWDELQAIKTATQKEQPAQTVFANLKENTTDGK